MKHLTIGFLAAIALLPAAALAKDKDKAPPPEVFQAVIDCRGLSDGAARLACYDAKVAALATAQTSDDLFVASKDDIKKARRGLFGLSLPKISLFGNDDDDDEEVAIKEIDSTIGGVGRGQSGWVFTLDDGAVWSQTDGVFIRTPKSGQKIHIRRAALGSYFASVEGGLGVRVKRENR